MESQNKNEEIKYWEQVEQNAQRQLDYARLQLSRLALINTEEKKG